MEHHHRDKKKCAVCGEKAGVFTRIKLNDGLLCGDCVKKCSEHLEDYDEFTAEEIRNHLAYRERNKHSEMLQDFHTTLTLGEYEVLKIDEDKSYWMLTTPKRYAEENPDVFYLTQVTECEVIEKKELYTPVYNNDEDKDDDKHKHSAELKKKFIRKNQQPEYGYWFYVHIGLHHPCFSQIVMRVNKYIIREKNQNEYVSCKRQAESICDTFIKLCQTAKDKYGEK